MGLMSKYNERKANQRFGVVTIQFKNQRTAPAFYDSETGLVSPVYGSFKDGIMDGLSYQMGKNEKAVEKALKKNKWLDPEAEGITVLTTGHTGGHNIFGR